MSILAEVCKKASLGYCYTLSDYEDFTNFTYLSKCYSRSFILLNSFISQPGSLFINLLTFVAIIMLLFSIKNKYTAVGRSEICFLFYNLLISIALSIVVDNGFIGQSSSNYPLFVSVQMASISICYATLALTGLVNLKLWEDNTWLSKLIFKISAAIIGICSFVYHYETLTKSKPSLIQSKATAILLTDYGINAAFIIIYVVCQCLTSVFIVKNYWMIGAQLLGLLFFMSGQIISHIFSINICQQSNHYLDGMFVLSLSNLLSIMMVYKSWAISTTEDLEFSVNMLSNDEILDLESEKI
ncbi:related to Chitin synthase export chaperone [Hanseniaspora guilliermondii]|uniref:Chitin synthase export chaperone n=1 Tax=Hanseniaspora guilliermondii TaxID=56406 RepID=A0A1L0CMN7_9ASCO|nr:related to Chitin synthase export chaperone [Hanseniaspora guilliermondii]